MLVSFQGTLGSFASLCGIPFRGEDVRIGSISTDSREIGDHTLFCALRGENSDGNAFVPSAFANGAVAALCSSPPPDGRPFIKADDVFSVLVAAAKTRAARIDPVRIAVTGSVGKTTTKELIASILSLDRKTAKSEANFNTRTGMVLTMLSMPSDTEALICEAGMSARGEISEMSRILSPDIAVITNVGSAHLASLGSRENIALAKCEILDGMSPTGVLVYDGDEPLLRSKKDLFPTGVSFGFGSQNDVYPVNCVFDRRKTTFDLVRGGETTPGLCLPLTGKNHLSDALAAYAASRLAGADEAACRLGLLSYATVGKRANEIVRRGMHVIEDCYNAGPESMNASLENLTLLAGGGRKIAVLGDMLELGEASDAFHAASGKKAAECGLDLLITVGEKGKVLAKAARAAGLTNVFPFDTPEEALECLLSEGREGDTVLVKASHGMHFEKITDSL